MGEHPVAGDGRLELDELGGIIDHASTLDPGSHAEVVGGVESPSWGERLESAGVTPWVRRHRAAVASVTAAALLVVGAGVVWQRTRPEPLDMTVAVTATDADSNEVQVTDTGALSYDYDLSPARPGDSVRTAGLIGPGIASSFGDTSRDPRPRTVTDAVYVVPGCDDPALDDAKANDYRILVERTDAAGHVAFGAIDAPAGSQAHWPQALRSRCVQQWLDERVTGTFVGVSSDPARHVLTIDTTIHNGLSREVDLNVGGSGGSFSIASQQLPVIPDATVRLAVLLTVFDCRNPQYDAGFSVDGTPFTGIGLFANYVPDVRGSATADDVDLTAGPNQAGGQVSVRWSDAVQSDIDHQLQAMCRDMPAFSETAISARVHPNPALEANAQSRGSTDPITVRTVLDVETGADSVTVSDVDDSFGTPVPLLPVITTSTAAVRGRHARVTVDWAVSCQDQPGPPQLQLQLHDASGDHPARITMGDDVVARALLAACPDMNRDDASSRGWSITDQTGSGGTGS
jgi:hypothetical protein